MTGNGQRLQLQGVISEQSRDADSAQFSPGLHRHVQRHVRRARIIFTSTWTYQNLVISGAGGDFKPKGALIINQNLTLTAGTFDFTAGSTYSITLEARAGSITEDPLRPMEVRSPLSAIHPASPSAQGIASFPEYLFHRHRLLDAAGRVDGVEHHLGHGSRHSEHFRQQLPHHSQWRLAQSRRQLCGRTKARSPLRPLILLQKIQIRRKDFQGRLF